MLVVSMWIFWIAVVAVTYPYFIYPLLLLLIRPFVVDPASRLDDSYQPSVSIILAAYNEQDCLAAKLENCLGLEYPVEKLEILIGSDASKDHTNQIAESFVSRGIRFFSYQNRGGKMSVVNRLVAEATGEICVFSDISELFDRDVIHKLTRHFADREIGAVTGNHLYNLEKTGLGLGTRFYWRFQRFLQSIESRLSTICMCDGTIYAVRREWYLPPVNNTINDDVAVPLGIILKGKRVIFEAEAIARGNVLRQTRQFFRQKIRSQSGKYQNFVRFPRMFFPRPFIRFWIYWSHSVMPVLVPWFLLALLISNVTVVRTGGSVWFSYFLALQVTFYLTAVWGLLANQLNWYLPVISSMTALPFYFVTANAGSIFGLFAFLANTQSTAWRKVE
ncbi:MAG: glycosyltransferase family 2 protein [Pirellulaceae bacterium]|nr:glycosyltransferase family 2 protein [Pirellulaceae bacterium]